MKQMIASWSMVMVHGLMVAWRKRHSRCPESSGYLEEYYMRKQLAARRYSAAPEAAVMEDLHQMFAYAAELEQGFEAVEWNRHERLVVIGGIVLAHAGDEDLNLPAVEACVVVYA